MKRNPRAFALVAIAGWLIGPSYLLHIIGPTADTCNQGDDSAYVASLLLGPTTLAVSFALLWTATRRLTWSPWMAASLLLVVVAAVVLLVPVLLATTVRGGTLCESAQFPSLLDRVWAPVQLIVALLFGAGLFRVAGPLYRSATPK